MKKRYRGIVVPTITPFNADYSLDEESVRRMCCHFEKHRVSLLLLGTTGESASISARIGRRLVEIVVGCLKGKTDIYVCLTGNCLEENVDNAKAYIDAGADIIVSTLPCYFSLSPEQMFGYYVRLVEGIDFPIMLYNIPATTKMSIPLEIIERLSHHPKIIGLKDSERSIDRIKQSIEVFSLRSDFSYFSGFAAYGSASLRLGADGIVPSTANFVPGMFRRLYDSAILGQWDTANQLQAETDMIAKVYQNGRPLGESLIALKVMVGELGLCQSVVLPPLTDLDAEEAKQIVGLTREIIMKHRLMLHSHVN